MKFLIVFWVIMLIGGKVSNFILLNTVGAEAILENPDLAIMADIPVAFLAFLVPVIMFRPKKKISRQKILETEIPAEFETKYQYLYNSKIKSLERKRIIAVCGIIIQIIAFCCTLCFGFGNERILLTAFITFVVLGLINILLITKYVNGYKQDIISNFINLINPNLKYQPYIKSTLIENEYRIASFDNKMFNTIYVDDYIEGFLNNNTFIKMCDLNIEYHVETKADIEINKELQGIFKRDKIEKRKTHHIEEIFRGIFVQTQCEGNVEPYVKISKNKIDILHKNRVEMDSSEFEKYFDVYSQNKIIAMQVLTSDVMMMLLDFYNKYKIKYEIVIRNKKIYIRFFTGTMFEPKIFGNSIDKKLILQYLVILKFVLDVTNGINKALKEI